jgi:hypothetical protein
MASIRVDARTIAAMIICVTQERCRRMRHAAFSTGIISRMRAVQVSCARISNIETVQASIRRVFLCLAKASHAFIINAPKGSFASAQTMACIMFVIHPVVRALNAATITISFHVCKDSSAGRKGVASFASDSSLARHVPRYASNCSGNSGNCAEFGTVFSSGGTYDLADVTTSLFQRVSATGPTTIPISSSGR